MSSVACRGHGLNYKGAILTIPNQQLIEMNILKQFHSSTSNDILHVHFISNLYFMSLLHRNKTDLFLKRMSKKPRRRVNWAVLKS